MPSPHDLTTARFELPTARRALMAFAVIVAVSLLSFYVRLLHESVALGEQMRERQRGAQNTGTMKAAAQRAPQRRSADRNARFSGTPP